uniref:Uncharacterized protein n=1 Tax=Physcomitrium patens TaxID=3218 RepID=A0A2K1L2D4_PHYPA|nr:hypothetical protein PHYPA_002981 [Physcomitrium patens]
MAGGPYSGSSTLALVARISAVSIGVVYGSMKLAYLKAKEPAPAKH